MELLISEFIEQNNHWKDCITQKPYCIEVKEKNEYTLLKYNQIESNFNIPLVRECRGIILRDKKIVCFPFRKFGNQGEGYADDIDWASAKVLEKVDGSITKIWFDITWHISTNGCIDAHDADIPDWGSDCEYKNYYDLIECALKKYIKFDNLSDLDIIFKHVYTYIFEMVSPYTKVVVPYPEIDIYLIGIRNNITYEEEYIKEHELSTIFKTPKYYDIHSLDDCIAMTKEMPFSEEGFVVVDKYFHRNKIKSIAYLKIFRLKGEGVVTPKRMLELIQTNESGEFLAYFPEYTEMYNLYKSKYDKLIKYLDDSFANFWEISHRLKIVPCRQKRADHINKYYKCPDFMFKRYDKMIKDGLEYCSTMRMENLVELLKSF